MNRSYNRRRGSRMAFQTMSSFASRLLPAAALLLLTASSTSLAADTPAVAGDNATIFALRLGGGWLYVTPPTAGEAPSYVRRTAPAYAYSVQPPAFFVPAIVATKTDAFPDPNTNGEAAPGETITYTVVILNSGDDALGVVFEDTIDPNTTFVDGTLQTTPLAINDAYDALGNVGIAVPAASGVLANDVDPDGSGFGTPPITAYDITTAEGGTVTLDPNDGSFTYVPAAGFEGVDSFTYTIDDGEGNTDTATVTINVSAPIWFVDNAAAGPGDGRLNTPFNTLAAFEAVNGNGGANDPAAGECIFIAENGAGPYTGGVTLEAQQTLVGEGASDPLAVVCGVTEPPFSQPLPATGGARPVITNGAGNGVTVATDNLLRGFDVGSTSGAGISGSSFGTLAASEVDVAGAGRTGRVLDLSTGTLTASFGALGTTSSGGPAVSLSGLTAASVVTVTGSTSLTGLSGDGVVVQNAAGATLGFGATTVSTTSGDAVDLATGNTGATFTFASLDLDNTGGNGILASNSGTINLTGTANTIDVTGGAAVDVQGTSLGSGWTFVRVSAATATSGIVLHDASGGFAVTGDGSGTQNASGGTITNMLGNAVDLQNVDDVVLASMSIQNSQGNGILGLGVDGFSLVGSVLAANGNAIDESGIRFGDGVANGLTGVALIQDVLVEQSPENNVEIVNTSGSLDLTITGSTFDFDEPFPGLRAHNVLVEMRGTAQATLLVTNNTFEDTGARGMHVLGFQDASVDFTFTGNAVHRVNTNGHGVHVGVGDNADVTFDISDNGPFADISSATGNEAIVLNLLASSTPSASMIGTVARNGNVTNSGGFLKIDTRGQGKATILVQDNGNVSAGAPGPIATNREALDFVFGDSGSPSNTGDVDVTVIGNVVSKVTNSGDAAVYIEQFTKNVPVEMPNVCLNVRGNTASVPVGSGDDAYLFYEDVPGDMQLESGPTDCAGGACADAEAQIAATNTGTPVSVDDLTLVPPGTCATPPAALAAASAAVRPEGREALSQLVREIGSAAVAPLALAPARRPAPEAAETTPAPAASVAAVTLAGETITVPIGTLPAGKDITITWDVTVADPFAIGVDQVSNQGTVSGDNFADVLTDDPDAPGADDPTVTPIEVNADLSIAKADSPDPVVAGTNLTYTLTLANDGPDGAANVEVSDVLPANTTFVSASVTSGTGWTPTTPAVGGTGTVSFTKAAVAASETATFEIVVAVDAGTTDGAVIENTATVTSTTDDPDPADNAATSQTTVEGITDLSIDKAGAPDPVVAGTNLTYTLTFANAGPNAAADVEVEDVLPANTTFVSASVTTGTGWTPATPTVGGTGTVSFEKAAVAISETATFEIVVKVDPGAGGVVENTATVTSATVEADTTNNAVTITTVVKGEADLSIAKTASPDTVVVGSNITYTLSFANAGPSAAGAVEVSDVLPANTTFVSASVTTGSGWTLMTPAVGGTGTVTFDKMTVAASETATFEIVVAVDETTPHGTVIENTATTTSATTDPNTANNASTTETDVLGAADLAVTKTDSPDPVEAGANLTYTITFVNDGPAPSGVEVEDVLPANTTFVSASVTTGSGWNVTAPAVGGTGTVTFDKAAVAVSEEAAFEIVVKVDNGTAGATITNTVTATGTVPDPDPANNTATTETAVIPGLAHSYLLLADQKIKVDGAVVSIGDYHSNDDIDIHKGNPTTYTGDITARDDIKIDKNNTIDGDVTAGGDINLQGNVTVTGTATENASVAFVPLPSLSFSAGGADVTVPKNQTQSLAPGSYDEIEVRDGGTLQLSSGVYYINDLKLSKDATLRADVSGGTITVNVVDEFKFDKNTEVEILPGGEAQSRWLTFNSRGDIDIHKDSRILGSFYAPDDKVKIDKDTYFRGSIAAEEIDIHKDVTLLHHDAVVVNPSVAPVAAGEMLAGMAGELPQSYALGNNYPNPFNPSTTIGFDLPETASVRLTVYDVLGREVARLVDGVVAAGRHQVQFDASNLPSGMYFFRMEAAAFQQVRQMILLK